MLSRRSALGPQLHGREVRPLARLPAARLRALRFGAAALVFCAFAYARERSLAIQRRDLVARGRGPDRDLREPAPFVYAIKLTTATTVALLFGTVPVLTGIFAFLLGIERSARISGGAAALAFGGIGLVAVGSGGGVSGELWGDLLALAAAATWAWYRSRTRPHPAVLAVRLSSVAFPLGAVPFSIVGRAPARVPERRARRGRSGCCAPSRWSGRSWSPTSSGSAGSAGSGSRARRSSRTCSPSSAAMFALLLLSEPITRLQVAGGLAIAGGILLSRRARSGRE